MVGGQDAATRVKWHMVTGQIATAQNVMPQAPQSDSSLFQIERLCRGRVLPRVLVVNAGESD